MSMDEEIKTEAAPEVADEPDRRAEAQRFAAECGRLLQDIPDFAGQSYFEPYELRCGIIADEEDLDYYRGAIELVPLAADGWEERIGDLDLLLYVSCRDGGGFGGEAGRELAAQVLRTASAAGVPTVFQSTADPAGFETFLPVAAEADYVFSIDEDLLEDYRSRLAKAEVHFLNWGVNPAQHNPLGFLRRLDADADPYARDAYFADSWNQENEQYAKEATRLFKGVLTAKDARRLFIAGPGGEDAGFPEEYRDCIVEGLSREEAKEAQKLFHYALNLNAAQDSRSACARRVFEAQAQGSLVIGNYSVAVSNDFPGLFTITDSSEVGRIMAGYTQDEVVAMEVEGIRRMYSGNTVYDRLGELLSRTGLAQAPEPQPVQVVVEEADKEAKTFLRMQSCPGAVLVPESEADSLKEGYAIRLSAPYPSIPFYLQDLVNAFKFSDASWAAYADSYEGAYEPVEGLAPEGPVMRALSRPIDDERGILIVRPRWGRDTAMTPKELAVILPIYNNGRFLWGRSFRSLLRSSIFERMQVYLIDDGSTDGATEFLVSRIAHAFENVTAYLFDDGGSGSPSRPRNKGIKLSREPYLTFLDPDNEARGDGYATLLHDAKQRRVELAFGNYFKVHRGGRVQRISFYKEAGRIDDPSKLVSEANFEMLNPQSCVIQREVVERSDISFCEGGIGEDVLFGYEVLFSAQSAWCRNLAATVYWSDREGSLVNSVDPELFRKMLVVHEQQAELLKNRGLIKEYRERRLDGLLKTWLIPELARVSPEDLPEAASLVIELVQMYDDLCCEEERNAAERKELEAITAARSEEQKSRSELERTRSSASWKIGRAITWLPRKIKGLFKKS